MSDTNTDTMNEMLEAHGLNTRRVRAWTRAYRPMIMGGDVNANIIATLDCDPPVHAGKGIFVQVAHGPGGITAVVEPISGGLVGAILEEVMADIADCDDVDLMRGQIEKARDEFDEKGGDPVSTEEFWRLLAKGRVQKLQRGCK